MNNNMTTIKTPGSIPENLTATHTSITTNLRIQKEQAQLARSKPTYIHDIIIQNDNQKQWDILLLPPRPPYNDGMFRLRLTFPNDYPFKPPHLRFVTPIYHPNIDEKGQMCLAILQYDNWKPGTNIESSSFTIFNFATFRKIPLKCLNRRFNLKTTKTT
uniref:UBIQUITIN_CONJUGAT_2 domain-containing protein n=1 Tax=Loa loa TaxID=7209 RepID=A0A1I7W1N9_LOALO